MRIRKNAKLVTSSSSSSSSSFLVCQLNRSPWDVDSFSLQGEWEDNGFGGSNNNIAQQLVMPSSNSLFSVESMELSYEYVDKPPPPPPSPPRLEIEERENGEEEERIGALHNDNRSNGWQHIHHQLKPPPISEVGPPLPPVPAPPKKRGRPKKPKPPPTTTTTTNATPTSTPIANSNNPYEFYYYSGFGPSWGKRRGGKRHPGNKNKIISGDDGSNCDNAIINGGGANDSGCSSGSLVMSEDDAKDDHDNNNNNNNNNVVLMESVAEGELDYIEDDFDDDDDDDAINNLGGRRVRKPVKARSLKSLM